MSWLAGVFTRAAGDTRCQDELDSATPVNAEPFDDDFNDLAEGINQTIPADGTKAMTGDLDMGNQDITNVNQVTGTVSFTGGVSFGGGVASSSAVAVITDDGLSVSNSSFGSMLSVANDVTTIPSDLVITGSVPSAANSAGVTGQIAVGGGYIYVCVSTDTWQRVNTGTWF